MEFAKSLDIPDSAEKEEAQSQLSELRKKYDDIWIGNNAQFLQGNSTDPKIGIYDLDCVDRDHINKPPSLQGLVVVGPILIALAEKITKFMGGPGNAKLLLGVSLLSAIGFVATSMSSKSLSPERAGDIFAVSAIMSFVAATVVGVGIGIVSTCRRINKIWKRASVSQ
jgi:hypothetical protein